MKNRLTISLVILALAIAGTASAQMGSELKGRVIFDNAPMPGVTVTLTSPALQGQKVTVSNAQGDYIFKALPAGHGAQIAVRVSQPVGDGRLVVIRVIGNAVAQAEQCGGGRGEKDCE